MRSAEQFYPSLLNWAGECDWIRVVLQTSSRTNPHAFRDRFTDYDIELYVNNLEWFLQDNWLSHFGTLIAAAPLKPAIDQLHITRLVLFDDGTKMDFQIYQLDLLEKVSQLPPEYDNGYEVLLDKDKLTPLFKPPSFQAYHVKPPTKDQYAELVNSFWWDTSYVAKSLWRDELFFSKYMLDSIIRINYLQPMIEWHIGVQHSWGVNPNKHGRWFKRYVQPALWTRIEQTYAGSSVEDNWNALFNTMNLFSELAIEVGAYLSYPYDKEMEERLTAYCKNIYTLP
ncbi:aminoglycoside 6-adenylyltransferase [Jeotgalibacillus sp. S-D1]|uniref:aminoglycoside 6-adenylyltransferase n=1 Tax=Jeotgalibacillus sp. S-D1 TaxID=2552189 RepID=UPI0014050B3D|nr:aminoglycoside 6-adenylyltransferase [Jeotgalibacillus sp. S-D1]